MSNAPETKYTDRDVREDSDLVNAAYNYLANYQGEFQYLVDCKMRLHTEGELPTGLVRGTLNCMRVDPRVTGLPAPLPPDEVVTQFRSRRPRTETRTLKECEETDFHGWHRDDGFVYCSGIYELNRDPYKREATLRGGVGYVAAKSPTSLMHKVPALDKQDSWCIWYPNRHEIDFYADPDFFTRPLCNMPRVLKNPILLTHSQYMVFMADEELSRLRCERCFN